MSLHVVFGYGQIGPLLASRLAASGHQVRVVSRHRPKLPPGIEHLAGDASDEAFTRDAVRGATAAYHCINVPYPQWFELLPRIGQSLRQAALASAARLVVLDNLYMLGRPDAPMTEATPLAPRSKKGELRARLELDLLASRERGLELAIGRASDFFGPGVTGSAVLHPTNLKRLVAGKRVDVGGDPDAPHSYSYAPDVAAGLFTLGTSVRVDEPIWHLPVAFQGTTRALVEAVGRALGVDAKVGTLPGWMWLVAGLFSPMIREAKEMTYQWEGPFVLDDSRFRSAFGVEPTPRGEAIAATAAWIRERFGR
ncbi:NAD-dependent epimerase/dehydratase family protein [Vulgatibacter sp.]|uniref:NAD-dependent epimerase/dehydratase family protein n=1 Tax=Vulgatibacter sp. TaxID=1971226 RepID=UPI00356356C5